ncbi:MAG: ABC transporter permease subunit [Thermoguttaceae bacterium]|nr:ABC transporter permease subunit [Thermoguttaceae bacterium]MDW8036894.1 ABC transporter permease subunit [Thermoguttaceae bacterium]
MWTYLIRRLLLMIPTLFGVTLVAFVVMQTAPGDPMLMQLGPGGTAGQSTETREAYLIRKRDLKLDKPLVLNFNYFRDYSQRVRLAAYFMALSKDQLARELPRLARVAKGEILPVLDRDQSDAGVQPSGQVLVQPAASGVAQPGVWASGQPGEPNLSEQLAFLRSLEIDGFESRLADPEQHERLSRAILHYVQTFCEDHGVYAVPAAMQLLSSPQTSGRLRLGAVRCLVHMVVEPFQYTYPTETIPPTGPEDPVVAVWRRFWQLRSQQYPPIDEDRRVVLDQLFSQLLEESSRAKQFELLERFDRDDVPYFIEKLLHSSPPEQKRMAAAALKLFVARPLELEAPPDATDAQLEEVAGNWLLHFDLHRPRYEPSLLGRLWAIIADTQYAHMVWRLITFQFGRSAVKTREPVIQKIWSALVVSFPLMLMAELVIYFVAVPLGILCAVKRGSLVDRLITLGLFLLYSIPGFVAGMLFLIFLCYGDFLKIFPSLGLHSEGAENWGFFAYLLDYLWHAFLPVICLSLFSLAGLAMYSRTAMLDVLSQDYIRTARAKGLSEGKVIFKHALRNALIPILTLFATFLPALLGGSVLVEYLFGIPGMGRLSWECIEQKDFPTLMALIYIDALVVMFSILLTDILYVVADPRISFEAQSASGG